MSIAPKKIINYLAPLLGQFTAANAVEVFSRQVGLDPKQLSEAEVAALADALKPMLRIFVGSEKTEQIAQEIIRLGEDP